MIGIGEAVASAVDNMKITQSCIIRAFEICQTYQSPTQSI